jgi:hypothetical protein
MKIRIPFVVVRAWDLMADWSNVPIYTRGRFEIRRIDVLLAIFGVACVAWYWYTGGWQGALLGGSMYILMVLVSLWLL